MFFKEKTLASTKVFLQKTLASIMIYLKNYSWIQTSEVLKTSEVSEWNIYSSHLREKYNEKN